MATYTYKCEKCEIEVETSHGMTESPTVMCPVCDNAGPLFKVITGGVGVIFKGRTGLRTSGGKDGGWDWGTNRPNPSDGHKLTKEERMHIDATKIKKFLDGPKPPPSVSTKK